MWDPGPNPLPLKVGGGWGVGAPERGAAGFCFVPLPPPNGGTLKERRNHLTKKGWGVPQKTIPRTLICSTSRRISTELSKLVGAAWRVYRSCKTIEAARSWYPPCQAVDSSFLTSTPLVFSSKNLRKPHKGSGLDHELHPSKFNSFYPDRKK